MNKENFNGFVRFKMIKLVIKDMTWSINIGQFILVQITFTITISNSILFLQLSCIIIHHLVTKGQNVIILFYPVKWLPQTIGHCQWQQGAKKKCCWSSEGTRSDVTVANLDFYSIIGFENLHEDGINFKESAWIADNRKSDICLL